MEELLARMYEIEKKEAEVRAAKHTLLNEIRTKHEVFWSIDDEDNSYHLTRRNAMLATDDPEASVTVIDTYCLEWNAILKIFEAIKKK